MKPRGPHRDRALSPIGIKSIKEPGRYADGNGLYLVVDDAGNKRWVLRTVARGRRRDIGLGSADLVTLAEARGTATRFRKIARDGGDPVAVKRSERRIVPTFEEAARTVHEEHKGGWRNEKHRAQWINTLQQHVFPTLGSYQVNAIDTPDILKVLLPIWRTKPETARRIRQRIKTVFDWAKASGFRAGDNPVDGVAKGLPKQTERRGHHAALPFDHVSAFIRDLRGVGVGEATKLALEFVILTAARTNEVLGATWDEFDLDQKVWTIPASRMKSKREHRVPLVDRPLEILQRLKVLAGNERLVCPGRQYGKPLSNMAFLMTLRRMKSKITVHGFRSAFRDWASERTNFPSEVCEMALAHAIRDKTEAAYRRGDLFEKRRELMTAWASFCSAPSADILPFKQSAGRQR